MKAVWCCACAVSLAIVGCNQKPASIPPAADQASDNRSDQPVDRVKSSTLESIDLSKAVQAETPVTDAVEPAKPSGEKPSSISGDVSTAGQIEEPEVDPSVARPVDLTKQYIVKVADFPDQDYPFIDLPHGEQRFGKVPVTVGGLIFLWGRNHASRGMVFPEFVEAIPVNRKFDSLYVYHFTRWKTADGTPVLNVILNYENDEHASSELRYGEHVRDWYWKEGDPDGITDPLAKKVWQGQNSQNENGQLLTFVTEIKNPRPNNKVVSIDLVSALKETTPAIMGLSTGPSGLLADESSEE